jgi:cytochrome c-type biogenesis protein CcmH/NrfF
VTARRLVAYGLLVMVLATAGVAVWRSAAPRPETAGSIAADLLCPACQGESVAQSQSPMAAAMRVTIAQQLSAGRSAAQIRQYFVDRYGAGILADPPHGGLGVTLWLVPLLIMTGLVLVAWRMRRRGPTEMPAPRPGQPRTGRSPRTWDVVAVAVVALVAVVAFASPRSSTPAATAAPAPQPAATLLTLGRSLESQGRYAEAADVYRDAVSQEPDDATRLRLAFALLRSDQPAAAATTAQQVLDHSPANSEALLLLGLAQRATGSPAATSTLRRFLAEAPDDPAAAQIRRLLGEK